MMNRGIIQYTFFFLIFKISANNLKNSFHSLISFFLFILIIDNMQFCNKCVLLCLKYIFMSYWFVWQAYASGCDIVILGSDFERLQIIPGAKHGNIQVACVDCSQQGQVRVMGFPVSHLFFQFDICELKPQMSGFIFVSV